MQKSIKEKQQGTSQASMEELNQITKEMCL